MKGWVIVRVWLPRDRNNQFVPAHAAAASGGNVGHASLETAEVYASFWPSWQNSKKAGLIGALTGEATGVLIPDVEMDIMAEKKQPDVEVVLFSLNVANIKREFEKFARTSISGNWSMMGANIFNIFKGGGGQSCSGLVFDLLNAGGIQKMIKWDFISKMVVVAPDSIARGVVYAANHIHERQLGFSEKLPPGIMKRVKEPGHTLNPNTWEVGQKLGEPQTIAVPKAKL